MKLALLADIHANGPALEAVLARIDVLGADRLVFMGDLVGYGPDPVAVTERVAGHVAKGALVLMGNHDEAAITGRGNMNPTAAAAIAWTHTQLGAAEKDFLKALPLKVELDDVLLVHADGSAPGEWHYVTDKASASKSILATAARITLCGHVHVPAVYHAMGGKVGDHRPVAGMPMPLTGPRRWLAVCGSVGQPRDGNPAASFAILDTAASTLTYHRAPYDADGVARRIRDAGLPESLAVRLVKGM